jgi:hypothetical protein
MCAGADTVRPFIQGAQAIRIVKRKRQKSCVQTEKKMLKWFG